MRFGRAILGEWHLRPDAAFLNNGSFGATPRRVLAAQQALQEELERQPVAFMYTVEARYAAALTRVGHLLGADPAGLAFVSNATEGANAVLRSMDLQAGDRVLTTSWAYGAVHNTLRYVARRAGAVLDVAHLPFPVVDEVDWSDLRARLPGASLLVIDHIASKTAVVLPVAEIVAAAHDFGVPVLVDGAHVPGQLDVDLDTLGADWWVGNLHKWAFAPKGCAVLSVAPQHRATIHPAVISHGLDQGLHAEFHWTGTRDPSAWLTAPAALAFLEELGVEAVHDWQRHLREEGTALLEDAWGVTRAAPPSCLAAMSGVPLPFPGEPTFAGGEAVRSALWRRHRVEVPVVDLEGQLWLRFSAHVFNDRSDLERLAAAIGPDGVR